MVWKRLGFEVRTMAVNLEAQLRDQAGVRHGKVEWKGYADGERKLKVRFQSLEVSEGTGLAVFIAGRESGRLRVEGGRGRLKVRGGAEEVPEARLGESVELRDGDSIVLAGVLKDD